MQRKEFIKKLIGADYKKILNWAGLLLIYVFLSFDFTDFSYNTFAILRLAGILLFYAAISFLAIYLVAVICNQLIRLLPLKVVNWFNQNRQIIDLLLTALVLLWILYYSLTESNYVLLVLVAGSSLYSFLQRRSANRRRIEE